MWNSRKKTIYSPMSAVLKTNRSENSLHPYRFLLCIFAYTFIIIDIDIITIYCWDFIFFVAVEHEKKKESFVGEDMKNRWREKLEVINQVIISWANRTKMMILYQFAVVQQKWN